LDEYAAITRKRGENRDIDGSTAAIGDDFKIQRPKLNGTTKTKFPSSFI